MRESSPPTEDRRARVDAAIREVLRTCDADRLARRLGLCGAEAADALRANEAALSLLTGRLADGCRDLTPEEAERLTRSLFGDDHSSSGGRHA